MWSVGGLTYHIEVDATICTSCASLDEWKESYTTGKYLFVFPILI